MIGFADREELVEAALGGRVAHSGFQAAEASSALRRAVIAAGAAVTVTGGFPGAKRRVVTAHPSHIPEAAPQFVGLYLPGLEPAKAADALSGSRVDERWCGDVVAHQDGVSVVTLDPPDEPVLRAFREVLARAGGGEPEPVPLERVAAGASREDQVVVPSLRVDALGAKGFRTSRSWFTKGIAGGNVYLNGDAASKGSEAAVGDEIYARGLGWIRVEDVEGETRRGNVKVRLTVEKT